jgi:hypothetical protein
MQTNKRNNLNGVRVLLVLATLTATVTYNQADAALPDPVLLLHGVESARLQIPPSSLVIRRMVPIGSNQDKYELHIDFDAEAHRFTSPTMGQERIVFDGQQVMHFDGEYRVNLVSPTDPGHGLFSFDPRFLGLGANLRSGQNFNDVLPYRTATSIETVGREQVNNHWAWHVRLSDTNMHNRQVDVWIDERNGFRVYRYDERWRDFQFCTIQSFYEDKSYEWLPSRVQMRVWRPSGEVQEDREFRVISPKAGLRFAADTWTIAGVRPPVGTEIHDRRISKVLGYWNGKSISPDPTGPPVAPVHWPGWATVILLVVIAGFPVVLLTIRRLARRTT